MPRCTNSSCLPPEDALAFSIPNGEVHVSHDTTTMVTLPDGVITDAGINAIYHYLYDHSRYYSVAREVTAFLNYTEAKTSEGRWTKRFAKRVYLQHAIKVDEATLAHLGVMVENHSKGTKSQVLVSRDLNRPARYWGHEASCLWGSEYPTRCMLKSNGGFGLLGFDPNTKLTAEQMVRGNYANGRIWVMPLKLRPGKTAGEYHAASLTPTFNTLTPDAFILFNGYGQFHDFQGPKILAQMMGMSYLKVQLEINGMYLNSANGYAVMSPELAKDYVPIDGRLKLIKFATPVHSSLYDFERAEWIESLPDPNQIVLDEAVEAINTTIDLSSEEKERQRRERYNEKRRQQRALVAAAAAAQVPGPAAVPNFDDILDAVHDLVNEDAASQFGRVLNPIHPNPQRAADAINAELRRQRQRDIEGARIA